MSSIVFDTHWPSCRRAFFHHKVIDLGTNTIKRWCIGKQMPLPNVFSLRERFRTLQRIKGLYKIWWRWWTNIWRPTWHIKGIRILHHIWFKRTRTRESHRKILKTRLRCWRTIRWEKGDSKLWRDQRDIQKMAIWDLVSLYQRQWACKHKMCSRRACRCRWMTVSAIPSWRIMYDDMRGIMQNVVFWKIESFYEKCHCVRSIPMWNELNRMKYPIIITVKYHCYLPSTLHHRTLPQHITTVHYHSTLRVNLFIYEGITSNVKSLWGHRTSPVFWISAELWWHWTCCYFLLVLPHWLLSMSPPCIFL